MHIPNDVAKRFVEEFSDSMLIHHKADTYTCDEIDALTALLCALGAHEVAESWLESHARGDSEDDEHYRAEVSDAESTAVSA